MTNEEIKLLKDFIEWESLPFADNTFNIPESGIVKFEKWMKKQYKKEHESQQNKCDSCQYSDEQNGEHCYECIKGMNNNFKPCEDCRNCKKWNDCPCGKEGHKNGTSIGYSIGECKDYEPCEDYIRREDAIRIASINSMPVNECVRLIKELPPVQPLTVTDFADKCRECGKIQGTKSKEIIKRIEEARDKDKIAEYPYNRCIKIIKEVMG